MFAHLYRILLTGCLIDALCDHRTLVIRKRLLGSTEVVHRQQCTIIELTAVLPVKCSGERQAFVADIEVEAHIEVRRALTEVDTGTSALRQTIGQKQLTILGTLEGDTIDIRIGVAGLSTNLRLNEATEEDAFHTRSQLLHFVLHLCEVDT